MVFLSSRSVDWCDDGATIPVARSDVSCSNWWHPGATMRSGRLRWVVIISLTACIPHFWMSGRILNSREFFNRTSSAWSELFAEHSWMAALPRNGFVTCQSPISCRFWHLFRLAAHIIGLGNHMNLISLWMKIEIVKCSVYVFHFRLIRVYRRNLSYIINEFNFQSLHTTESL